jgi:cytoskeleton protein RodZ
LLGTFVVALILLAGWFLYQESESLDFERVAELPEHLVSKIRDLEDPVPENTSDGSSLDSPSNNQNNTTEITVAAPVVVPDVRTGGTDASETKNIEADSVLEKDSPESAEAALSDGASDGTSTVLNSEGDNARSAEGTATVAAAADTSAETKVEAATVGTAGPSQDLAENESQTATLTEPTEEPSVAPSPTQPVSETPESYPQDTLDTALSQVQAAETPENPLPRTFGVENTDARVVVRATEESWVEVKASDENPILSRVLKPGDVYMAPNAPDLILTTGNAGGLEIRVDGQEIRALGGAGTILREVPLVAESLLENSGLQ